jgi:hypothetical protein
MLLKESYLFCISMNNKRNKINMQFIHAIIIIIIRFAFVGQHPLHLDLDFMLGHLSSIQALPPLPTNLSTFDPIVSQFF